jgi:hypothetical protein
MDRYIPKENSEKHTEWIAYFYCDIYDSNYHNTQYRCYSPYHGSQPSYTGEYQPKRCRDKQYNANSYGISSSTKDSYRYSSAVSFCHNNSRYECARATSIPYVTPEARVRSLLKDYSEQYD